jgi:putative membrane protein
MPDENQQKQEVEQKQDMSVVKAELLSGNDMAIVRTALALDRTLLAWVRTSLTLVGFGFTLARYINHLIEVGTLHGLSKTYPREIGAALMALGVATLIGGSVEYVRTVKKIRPGSSPWSVSLVVAVVLAILSSILIVDLLFEISRHT